MKGIWVPVSAQIAQTKKVDTIANNIANINTAGFKKDSLVFKEHLTALSKDHGDIHVPREEFSPADFYRDDDLQAGLVRVDGQYIDFSQGQTVKTQAPLDVALQGPGMLEVYTKEGIRYTRRGNLSIDPEGKLVTDTGHPVLALSTQQGAISSNNIQSLFIRMSPGKPVTITEKGKIYQGGTLVDQLSVIEFKDPSAMRKVGRSLYASSMEDNTQVSSSTTVRQGFLEESNVNPINEMSELIKAHRQVESIQRAINAYDSIHSKAVNDIVKF